MRESQQKPTEKPTRMCEPMIAANDVSASTATLNVSPYCSCRSSRVFDLASGSNVNEATDDDGGASPSSSFSFDFLFFWLCCGAM